MKILVTGSSGRLGSVTVAHLKASGFEVTGIDVVPSAHTYRLADIKNKADVEEISRGFDAIIHTAALHGKHYDLSHTREHFIDINIYGTLNLLNACVKNNIGKFLYISSTSVYGYSLIDEQKAVWVDELLVEKPRDIYDITKQTAEQLCKDFFDKEGLRTSVYRVGRFLPEADNLTINHRAYRGLDERDGAEALRLAICAGFKGFEIFNISGGSPFKKEDLIKLKSEPEEVILKYYPRAAAIYKKNGWAFMKSIDRVYIIEKARQYFNYEPKYTFGYLLERSGKNS